MIGVLNDYCCKNTCDSSCEFVHDCKISKFSKMTDNELASLVERITTTIQINNKPQNECELEGKRTEPVKVLEQITKITYPEKMKDVLPIKEFVKNILEKGYKAEVQISAFSNDLCVVVYKEVEMKESLVSLWLNKGDSNK